jgi:hypothetical protein
MRDPHQHAARRRLFARAFSVSSLLANWEPVIRGKTELVVRKIKEDAKGTGADVFKWWTLMATDVIAELSFGESFRMLELGKVCNLHEFRICTNNESSKRHISTLSKRLCSSAASAANSRGSTPSFNFFPSRASRKY